MRSFVGALLLAALVLALSATVALLIRRLARRIGRHLTDATALGFVSAFAQFVAYLSGFVLYAHLIPELRAVGTALLAGVSVISIVVGVAAQGTLGNLVAGFSLVLYRSLRVGDSVRLASGVGQLTGRVRVISLGYTVLVDDQGHEVIVPNSVIMGSMITHLGRGAE